MKTSDLGLCLKAGKIVIGTEKVLSAIKSNKAYLVIVATDASVKTKKMFYDKCHTYKVQILEPLDSNTMSKALSRASIMCVAILDFGFANLLIN